MDSFSRFLRYSKNIIVSVGQSRTNVVRGIYCYIREKILENIEEVNLPDFLLSEDRYGT